MFLGVLIANATYAFLNDDRCALTCIDVLACGRASDGNALRKSGGSEGKDGEDELHCVVEKGENEKTSV